MKFATLVALVAVVVAQEECAEDECNVTTTDDAGDETTVCTAQSEVDADDAVECDAEEEEEESSSSALFASVATVAVAASMMM